MQTAKACPLFVAIVLTLATLTADLARAQGGECGGGGWSQAGCSNEGGSPTLFYTCSGGTGGDCYDCTYNCHYGSAEHCVERADGSGQRCEIAPDNPPPEPDVQNQPSSPILLDLDLDGFHLAGLDSAVLFDLDGSGTPEYHSWTSAGTRDAFLCRDLNGNGRIDSGRELFGNATLLGNGLPARNGYEALLELDLRSQGGNEDGLLTAEDPKFRELCVWVDANHNGISDPGEVLPLRTAGVVEISYVYQECRRRDAHGNQFRYKATAMLTNPRGVPRPSLTYDVYFLTRSAIP